MIHIVVFWLFTADGYRPQVEVARTAIRLIRDNDASVSLIDFYTFTQYQFLTDMIYTSGDFAGDGSLWTFSDL